MSARRKVTIVGAGMTGGAIAQRRPYLPGGGCLIGKLKTQAARA